jgi:hypothetical protein
MTIKAQGFVMPHACLPGHCGRRSTTTAHLHSGRTGGRWVGVGRARGGGAGGVADLRSVVMVGVRGQEQGVL